MGSTKSRGSVPLVHWGESEARNLAAGLREHGWKVVLWEPMGRLGDIKKSPPQRW